jgi:hypothetical protein
MSSHHDYCGDHSNQSPTIILPQHPRAETSVTEFPREMLLMDKIPQFLDASIMFAENS